VSTARQSSRPRHRDSPRVRRMAREVGVDLAHVGRTGRHGRATVADVREAASASAQESVHSTPLGPGSAEASVGMQHLLVVELDLTRLERSCENSAAEFERRHGAALTMPVLLAEAATSALAEGGLFTSDRRGDGGSAQASEVYLAVDVQVEGPDGTRVVKDPTHLSLAGLARRIAGLDSGAPEVSRPGSDGTRATLAVRVVRANGVVLDAPMIEAPGTATLTLGAVRRQPAVVVDALGQEGLAVRSMAYLSLCFDGRRADRAAAVRFLAAVQARLEHAGPAVPA